MICTVCLTMFLWESPYLERRSLYWDGILFFCKNVTPHDKSSTEEQYLVLCHIAKTKYPAEIAPPKTCPGVLLIHSNDDAIRCQRTIAQVMVYCISAQNQYMIICCLVRNTFLSYSFDGYRSENANDMYKWQCSEIVTFNPYLPAPMSH